MGRLISSSGLPENLIPRSFEDIQAQWIEKLKNPECVSAIGAFAYLTDNKFIDVLLEKNVGIVLSDAACNRRIITKQKKRKDSFVPDQEYKPIRKLNLKGISGENMDILNKTTNVENEAFRFILQSQIEIEKKGEVDSTYIQPMLHTKMLGLVDKNGIVYEWLTGGHNPTLNGNDSIDCFTSITDPKKINEYTDYWVYLWIESKILDRDKSPELINAVNYNSRDSNAVARAWKQAHFTVSKYVDEEVNFDDYFNASEFCKDQSSFFRSISNRQYLYNMSKKNNIPIGVPDEYVKQFQEELTISLKLRDFFPVQSEKPKKALILHIKYREKMLFHNSLKDYFLYWLNNKCSSKRKSQMPELNNEANSELEAAPEPTNNESKSKLEVTPETDYKTIKKIQQQCNENQKQNEEIQKQLNEIQKQLERLNGTQDKPTGEEFNKKFSTNGRAKDSSRLSDLL